MEFDLVNFRFGQQEVKYFAFRLVEYGLITDDALTVVGVVAGAAGGIDFLSVLLSQATSRPIVFVNCQYQEEMLRVVDQHSIKLFIDNIFDFEKLKDGWDHFAARDVSGKAMIRH